MSRPMHITLANCEGTTTFNVSLSEQEIEFVNHLCVLSEVEATEAWHPEMRLHDGPKHQETW